MIVVFEPVSHRDSAVFSRITGLLSHLISHRFLSGNENMDRTLSIAYKAKILELDF